MGPPSHLNGTTITSQWDHCHFSMEPPSFLNGMSFCNGTTIRSQWDTSVGHHHFSIGNRFSVGHHHFPVVHHHTSMGPPSFPSSTPSHLNGTTIISQWYTITPQWDHHHTSMGPPLFLDGTSHLNGTTITPQWDHHHSSVGPPERCSHTNMGWPPTLTTKTSRDSLDPPQECPHGSLVARGVPVPTQQSPRAGTQLQ